jgi:hypothetical protein
MDKLPAQTGWLWVKEGFTLFRKQPAEIATLFFGYMFLMLVVGIIPAIGQLIPLLLAPVFAITFMQACAYMEKNRKVYPNLLFIGFRSTQLRTLIQLGVLHLLAAVIAIAVSGIVDGGTFWQAMTGQLVVDESTVRDSNMAMAMLFATAVYIPAAIVFWFAAPLIAWQQMSVGKAIFFSFFAMVRAKKAFLAYCLAWAAINIVLLMIISTVIVGLLGSKVTILILLPMSMLLTIVMCCSSYVVYRQLFGAAPDFPV